MLLIFIKVFFVLNKKNQHISLLHMAHHGLMPISTWYGIRYHPGGHNTFFGFLNAFVHTVMYLYYLLAAMGPNMRPFLWWKKYLTTLQMIQFTAVFIHAMIPTVKECDVPPALIGWVGSIAVLFTILFADFYIKEYKKKNINNVKIKRDNDASYSSPNNCAIDQKSMITTTTTMSHDSHFTNGITRRVTCATVSNVRDTHGAMASHSTTQKMPFHKDTRRSFMDGAVTPLAYFLLYFVRNSVFRKKCFSNTSVP
ncbi:Elongation of very long chain fatty acids protein [Portunus trituberculatus]|uniref:Elongation of very long chain fatty acids protein n=1 Tax=Portunus trituberculatus TaxID=210409 RepID=A0A5B7ECW3_PORTR|nr:Elongation of very long chain fatty acids protein [Portunus trituberculatus]